MFPHRRAALSTTLALLLLSTLAHAQGRADLRRAVALTPAVAPTQAGLPPTKEATVFGQKIQYVDVGSGPVVVLLHGLGGNSLNWAFNFAALSAKYRVIAPDQIGFGRSDKPLINYRVGTYVDFLDKFLEGLNVERASLVGNSMGGWIAALYALKYPKRVERIVLADAAGFAPPKDFDLSALSGLNPSTREQARYLMNLVFFNPLLKSDANVDATLAARLSAGDGYTIQSLVESIYRNEDMLDGKLAGVKQPTLIIWGREDGLTPLAREGEKFKKEMPSAQFVIFDGCGHVPQVEKAAEFNAAVLKFLSQ
ncbi:MAG TPA: alpha/beta fold hydrolase [Pyrinomonadaceae bacterium]|jgi:pimeloyl-ACP methyl ester carboxylesterase|nr:alpha/beta fold hydrolase [Pyrinomonadaceae bacterium]